MTKKRCGEAITDNEGKVWHIKPTYANVHGECRRFKIYDDKCKLVEDYQGLLGKDWVEYYIKTGKWWKIVRQDKG